jgi:15-cis-phytoene synthase
MDLYSLTTFQCSKVITQRYSTSFTLGIKTLHKKYHYPIYAIYGFVRYADEIVDTFHDHDKAALLEDFKIQTFEAIERKISLNPVLHAFQLVVNEYNINQDLIEAFLLSMEMDLDNKKYNINGYSQYIYGSAEVVGLMCLKVFCEGNNELYDHLEEPARKLGAAFQKVNFLRDIKSDYIERGRIYFPGVEFSNFSSLSKEQIEADIEKDFQEAYEGIIRLPKGAKKGVYLAYIYYLKLFKKIRRTSASQIVKQRIRIPDLQKIVLLAQTYFKLSFNFL